jgi:hypothetical protein
MRANAPCARAGSSPVLVKTSCKDILTIAFDLNNVNVNIVKIK